MGKAAFIQSFYVKSAWSYEEGVYQRLGFVSGVNEGWFNGDGTQQSIVIIRFATPASALSEFDGLTGTLDQAAKPSELVSDSRDGGKGTIDPTEDSLGDTVVELVTHLGDYVIDVHEWAPATSDPTAAKSLLLQQYQAIKADHLPGA
jgi:hypothetical protein